MIALAAASIALAAAPAQAGDTPYIRCAFEKAADLAKAGGKSAEKIGDEAVRLCAAAGGADSPSPSDDTRRRMHAAAVAMVNRRRGTDGLPADAPFRLPNPESAASVRSFDIPDEIAPAVIPYLQCLIASAGTPLYAEGRNRPIAPPKGIGKGSDCAAFRLQAAKNADRLLRENGNKSKAERRALIEATLAGLEDFQRAPAPQNLSPKSPENAQD